MSSRITMPSLDPEHNAQYLTACQPYLAVYKRDSGDSDSDGLHTIIVGRDNTVLFFDPEDGTITHGTLGFLHESFRIVRPYRAGETLTYVQG